MTDEAEHPLSHIAEVEREMDAPEPMTGAQRLRAFEDKHLGEDVMRINGAIERGHGAAFHNLSPEVKAEHAALERLVKAEKQLVEATAALGAAQTAHAAAAEAVERHAGE